MNFQKDQCLCIKAYETVQIFWGVGLLASTLLYPSLCWNDAEIDDQHEEPMIDIKII